MWLEKSSNSINIQLVRLQSNRSSLKELHLDNFSNVMQEINFLMVLPYLRNRRGSQCSCPRSRGTSMIWISRRKKIGDIGQLRLLKHMKERLYLRCCSCVACLGAGFSSDSVNSILKFSELISKAVRTFGSNTVCIVLRSPKGAGWQ